MNKQVDNTNALDKVIVAINAGGMLVRDISSLVKKIDISETITGSLAGTLDIVDDQGTIDSLFLTGDEVINISFEYFGIKTAVAFYFNGISNINITSATHSKSYQIMLGSITDYIDASNLCSKCYDGTAVDIILGIFNDYYAPLGQTLMITNISSSPGNRFIVPNISPGKAIDEVRTRMYDEHISGFVMFERLVVPNHHTLSSLGYLIDLARIDIDEKTIPTLAPKINYKSEDGNSTSYNLGLVGGDIIIQDNLNLIDKTRSGIYGKRIKHLDIANSSFKEDDFKFKSQPAINVVKPFRSNMYVGDGIRPLNYPDDHNISIANAQTSVLFGISTILHDVVAVPGLGVGNFVLIDISDCTVPRENYNDNKSLKYNSTYMVSNINHIFQGGIYTQNITCVTGVI
jgi:hypothetical protein